MTSSVGLAEAAVSAGPAIAADPRPDWSAKRRRERWLRRVMPLVGAGALLFTWWTLIAVFDVKPFIAPAPQVVAATLVAKAGLLFANLVPTAIEAVSGFLVGNLFAIAIATVFVHYKLTELAFFPIIVLLHAIPVVAIAPILVLLLGNAMAPKIAIAAIICFFPTLVNMVRGLEAISPQLKELMHVVSATPWDVFIRLRVPTSIPYLFSALKITASGAVVGAIVGEWIGSQDGIGALIIQATYNFDSALLYATVAVGAAFSVLFFALIRGLERACVRWTPVEAR